ncbi:hypothetical protein [Streptomyces sp. NPDC101150]|uniref:hypothetical protein n=1 Tax=Streptomyces sp. NPDC101150 TaxID=3366114 RepID=UPI0037F87223
MTDRVLELLRTRPELAELAAFPFDFDVSRAYHVEDVHLASGASLEPIAGDDTGGTYFLCGGTAVLHASSEGDAVLFADSVGEALEMLVRLPGWCENVSAELDEEELRAAVRAADDAAREEFAPELDAQRAALISGLDLPDRPLTELFAMAESAAGRTEPDHVLLNSHELCAYRLDESYRQPLRDVVLAPGREALERMRSGDLGAWDEAAADPVLRAGVLRAARYDRRDGDLELLRFLLDTRVPRGPSGSRSGGWPRCWWRCTGRKGTFRCCGRPPPGRSPTVPGPWRGPVPRRRSGTGGMGPRRASSPGSSWPTGRAASSTPGSSSSACWTTRARTRAGSGS